jgi:beta-aspartyl-peptidase (threonine type)
MRHAVAYDVSARMAYRGQSVTEAVQAVIHETLRKNDGGIIAVSRNGEIAMDFNTSGMIRGAADSSGKLVVAIDPDPLDP